MKCPAREPKQREASQGSESVLNEWVGKGEEELSGKKAEHHRSQTKAPIGIYIKSWIGFLLPSRLPVRERALHGAPQTIMSGGDSCINFGLRASCTHRSTLAFEMWLAIFRACLLLSQHHFATWAFIDLSPILDQGVVVGGFGRPLEATGDHRGQSPRTDVGLVSILQY